MKTIKSILLIGALALGFSAQAQTVPGVTNAESGSLFLDSLTNIAFAPYVAYVESSHKLGGGILAVYNVSQNVGTGLGVEALGNQVSVLNGNVQFKVPTHPLSFLGLPDVAVTPWAGAFLGKSIGSGGSTGAAIGTGGGVYVDVLNMGKGWILSAGGGAVDWSGAGKDFDGWHILGFAAVHHGF